MGGCHNRRRARGYSLHVCEGSAYRMTHPHRGSVLEAQQTVLRRRVGACLYIGGSTRSMSFLASVVADTIMKKPVHQHKAASGDGWRPSSGHLTATSAATILEALIQLAPGYAAPL